MFIKKPWTLKSNLPCIVDCFSHARCPGTGPEHQHTPCAGRDTKTTERYTAELVHIVHTAFLQHVLVPEHKRRIAKCAADIALPCIDNQGPAMTGISMSMQSLHQYVSCCAPVLHAANPNSATALSPNVASKPHIASAFPGGHTATNGKNAQNARKTIENTKRSINAVPAVCVSAQTITDASSSSALHADPAHAQHGRDKTKLTTNALIPRQTKRHYRQTAL